MEVQRYITGETVSKLTTAQWNKLCDKMGTLVDNVQPTLLEHTCIILSECHGLYWASPSKNSQEMTYEELIDFISDFEEMKFVVHDADQATFLQKKLFEQGYSWKNGQAVINTGFKFFATTKSGQIICYWEQREFSKASGKRYITKVTVDFVEAETIEINGVTYLKEDVEKALASISPV